MRTPPDPDAGPGFAAALARAADNGAVPAATVALVRMRAGQLAGSTRHTLRNADLLRRAGAAEDRLAAVAGWRGAPHFTTAERAALELTEAVLAPAPAAGGRIPDELHARVAAHYGDRALWTLILAIAQSTVRPAPDRPRPPR